MTDRRRSRRLLAEHAVHLQRRGAPRGGPRRLRIFRGANAWDIASCGTHQERAVSGTAEGRGVPIGLAPCHRPS